MNAIYVNILIDSQKKMSNIHDCFSKDVEFLVQSNYESPLKVIIAALCIKINDPSCDTRYHQKTNGGKYCLRSIEEHTTAWCATQGYFNTNCVGSLSNGLRHKEPYNQDYSRVWRSVQCKKNFLNLFEFMNTNASLCENMLRYFLQLLHNKNKQNISLSKIAIESDTLELYPLLCNLCNYKCNYSSLIPVLIVHTYFEIIQHSGLLSLKHHNSPDIKGKSYGDIEIWNTSTDSPDTVIEIKHGLQIQEKYLETFANKVKNISTKNFILTSLSYQRYEFNTKYNVVCWNVPSFVHYNLYNKSCISDYIDKLYKALMSTSIDLKHKENLKNFFDN